MALEDVELPDVTGVSVGILGGTGPQGQGLAYRLARAGHLVTIGSRHADRAKDSATKLTQLPGLTDNPVHGATNLAACQHDIVIVAVPWEGHAELLTGLRDALEGRIVVDCVNPLGFDKQGPYWIPPAEGSAAQQAEALLPSSRVTAAFHHISAVLLADPGVDSVDCDVLVLGDDRDAAAHVQALANRIGGVRGVWAGRLRNAAQVEATTANLIAMNRRYKTHTGIRVTGL